MIKVTDLYSITLLKNKKIPYKLVTLSKVPKNADEITTLFGCKLSQVIKTLLFIGDNKPIIICVPGDKQVDINKVKQLFDLKALRMASALEAENITGYPLGGISPFFGYDGDLKRILDHACLEEDLINIGAGTKLLGIELAICDLQKVWDGLIENITK